MMCWIAGIVQAKGLKPVYDGSRTPKLLNVFFAYAMSYKGGMLISHDLPGAVSFWIVLLPPLPQEHWGLRQRREKGRVGRPAVRVAFFHGLGRYRRNRTPRRSQIEGRQSVLAHRGAFRQTAGRRRRGECVHRGLSYPCERSDHGLNPTGVALCMPRMAASGASTGNLLRVVPFHTVA